MKTKIKICGFTNPENARSASLLGIDAIGLVFYNKSTRCVNVRHSVQIINALPPFISRVGLFVNADSDFIDEVLCEVSLDTLQFHGDELPAECAQYGMPFIKALRVNDQTNIAQMADDYHRASGLLLDTFKPHVYGGTGEKFDWNLAKAAIDLPIILAGGISHKNAADAIKQVNPYAIDVSSSVESQAGIKDLNKIQTLLDSVR